MNKLSLIKAEIERLYKEAKEEPYTGRMEGRLEALDKLDAFIDSLRPKFHKGEWLCGNELNNYARFIQILEIVNVQGKERYRISRDIHNDEDIVKFDFVEEYFHKFDIQDAKDGDVLVDSEEGVILMFRGIGNTERNDVIDYHCYYRRNFIVQKGLEYWGNIKNVQLKPATQKQRELLFQKMKEAGYEWDAETKELKKVEQNPAWSEEDMRMIDLLVAIFEVNYPNGCYKATPLDSLSVAYKRSPEIIDWLKSLKKRVLWKPSEEQIKDFGSALLILKLQHYVSVESLESFYEQLKKLCYGIPQ